jgi:uncharacterized membrane protein YfcA
VTPEDALWSAAIGLLAGLLGGLAGIGGSMVMLPGLFLIFGDNAEHTKQHLYMAAAMVVNIVVSIPATYQHWKAGAMRGDLAGWLLPTMTATMVAGVFASNRFEGDWLRLMLAAFIAAYCVTNIVRVLRPVPADDRPAERTGPGLLIGIGSVTGFVGGLLGIGGGVLMVPALQLLARVRLRHAIATSSLVMCVTAAVGSGLKLATLGEHGELATEAWWLVLAMSPGAIVGAMIGASLVHWLPVRVIRVAISVLLMVAAAKLAGLW